MKRRLTPQEQVLVGLGGLVIVLLLAYAAITGMTRGDFRLVKQSLERAEGDYKEAVEKRQEYEQLGRRIEERKSRIAQRDPDFDLLSHIGKVEHRLDSPFEHASVTSPYQHMFGGNKYTLTRVTYLYEKKQIGGIIGFLYRIEDPEQGIIISNVEITTADGGAGEYFTLRITFSVVTELLAGP